MAKTLVIICSRNPKIDIFLKTVESIKRQSFQDFGVLIVDNASDTLFLRSIATSHGFDYHCEPRVGNAFARFTALQLAGDSNVIFVDDDNELFSDYVSIASMRFMNSKSWGIFGGQQFLPDSMSIHRYFYPLLPYIGVRQLGEVELSEMSSKYWSKLEPIGAGMCIRGSIVPRIREKILNNSNYFQLGRAPGKLLSGEDSFIARCCSELGYEFGYDPKLKMFHNVDKNRFRLRYWARLLYGYGLSDVILDSALGVEPSYPYPKDYKELFKRGLFALRENRAPAIGLILRWYGQMVAQGVSDYGENGLI